MPSAPVACNPGKTDQPREEERRVRQENDLGLRQEGGKKIFLLVSFLADLTDRRPGAS
jgi:hypothetical protein